MATCLPFFRPETSLPFRTISPTCLPFPFVRGHHGHVPPFSGDPSHPANVPPFSAVPGRSWTRPSLFAHHGNVPPFCVDASCAGDHGHVPPFFRRPLSPPSHPANVPPFSSVRGRSWRRASLFCIFTPFTSKYMALDLFPHLPRAPFHEMTCLPFPGMALPVLPFRCHHGHVPPFCTPILVGWCDVPPFWVPPWIRPSLFPAPAPNPATGPPFFSPPWTRPSLLHPDPSRMVRRASLLGSTMETCPPFSGALKGRPKREARRHGGT